MTTYAMPYSHLTMRASDLATMVVLLDGTEVTLADWKEMRVTPEEYKRLTAIKVERRNADVRSGNLTWDANLQTYTDTSVQEEPSW